jgi:hypothetical protein
MGGGEAKVSFKEAQAAICIILLVSFSLLLLLSTMQLREALRVCMGK